MANSIGKANRVKLVRLYCFDPFHAMSGSAQLTPVITSEYFQSLADRLAIKQRLYVDVFNPSNKMGACVAGGVCRDAA